MKTIALLMALFFLVSTAQAVESVVGKVGYMSGTLVAQRTDGTVNVLGPKSDVLAGDMLITAKDSYAQIRMNDGSRMTLRPDSNLRIEAFTFVKETPKSDNLVFRLLKGGFRAVTGLIGKRGNVDAYKVHAASTTIGIRGTDFSSRLCDTKDCQNKKFDINKSVLKVPVHQSKVIGRVMLIRGKLSVKEQTGKVSKLLLGAPIYEGDALMTAKESYAIVAFRDESRITLQQNTVFYVEKFKYDKAASQKSAVLRLIKGGVRVLTGLIGHINHENYHFKVANATIGIRGTGFDSWCYGPCASGADNPGATTSDPLDGVGVFVWSGKIALILDCASGGHCPMQMVGLQQAAMIARDTGKPVQIKIVPQSIINNATPRPDSIKFDLEKLFGAQAGTGEPGLYVTVHDGEVILTLGEKSLDLGRGETGYASENLLSRLAATPVFMKVDMQINLNSGNRNSTNPSINSGGCAVQ